MNIRFKQASIRLPARRKFPTPTCRRALNTCLQTVIVATGLLLTAGSAAAEGFHSGKNLTYIIATKPGGNYDAYARVVGKHLGKALGSKKVLYKNIPGAGHIIGTNTLSKAKPDGLTIGTFNTGLIYAQILQREGINFDLDKFSWIGKAAADARIIMLGSKSGMSSFDDVIASTEPVNFAAAGIGSASYTETKLLADAFDLNINLIPGFNGGEGEMALLRGEVHGQFGSYGSFKPFMDAGNGSMVLAVGGGHEPQAMSYAKTEKAKSIVGLVAAMSTLGRLTAAPPGVDESVLEELRSAYMSVMTDADFLAEAEKLGLSVDAASGADVAGMITAALQQSPETVELIANALDVKIPTVTVTSKIVKLGEKKKKITFKNGDDDVKAKISGSRTAITVNGKEAERETLVEGMSCEIEYDPDHEENEPKRMACSN